MLARDDVGALVVLGGRYRVGARGIMDHATALQKYHQPAPRYTPAGIAVHGRNAPREGLAVVRHNPLEMVAGVGRAIVHGAATAGVVTGTGVATALVTDVAVERVPVAPAWRGVLQIVVPALAAGACASSSPRLALGLLTGGVVPGAKRLVAAWGWDAAVSRMLDGLMRPANNAAGVGDLPFGVKLEARAE